MVISEKLLDKRVVNRNIKKGSVNTEEYQRFLNKLPDRSENIYKPETEERTDPTNSESGEPLSEIEKSPSATQQMSAQDISHAPGASFNTQVTSAQQEPTAEQYQQPTPPQQEPTS